MKSERPRHHRPAARLCATPVRGGGAHRLAPFGRIHGGGDGLPEKVDQVPARSAARIEHAHPRPNTAPEQLIEEVDVDLAELLLKIGHWFSPDHTGLCEPASSSPIDGSFATFLKLEIPQFVHTPPCERPLRWITEPGTLEGGDVVRIGVGVMGTWLELERDHSRR